jgi:hypothetical protein
MGNSYSVEMSKEVEMQNVKEKEKEDELKWRALRSGSMKWMKNSSYSFIQLFVHSRRWIWGVSRRRFEEAAGDHGEADGDYEEAAGDHEEADGDYEVLETLTEEEEEEAEGSAEEDEEGKSERWRWRC